MAAFAPPADQTAELLQKLSLDSKPKTIEITDANKKISADSTSLANGVQSDRSVTPVIPNVMDPTVAPPHNGYQSGGYYYGGYETTGMEWEDYSRYISHEGVDMNPGGYAENGSVMYHPGYGYAPYGPYSPATSPVPAPGHDAQMYGAQHYQYPSPYFQSLTPTSNPYPSMPAPAKGEITTPKVADQATLDSTNSKPSGMANSGGAKNNGTYSGRVGYNGSYGRGTVPGGVPSYQEPRCAYEGMQSPMPWLDSPYFADGHSRPLTNSAMTSSFSYGNGFPSRNQNYQPHLMGSHHARPMPGMNTNNGYNRVYPNKLYSQYGNYRSGPGYGSNGFDSRINGRSWIVDSKFKTRGRGIYGYGNENMDGLNELNRGPRAKISKNQKGFVPVALAVKGQNIPFTVTADDEKPKSNAPDKEQFNLLDFPETYSDAKFFIIKSYSEDDVHKSIKYNVWSSTPNGNKKLDAAYLDAHQKSGDCPVFLYFSVNTSGQFVGVAEMAGPVDFNKNVEYWQQDKWIGCFPVKWHMLKDLPNSMLKHIILENNENKPVTNSRDTQEVKFDQGLEMLKIFKDHTSRQCILDDFDFYEDRQKRIQDKKAKQQQFQKQAQQVWEGKNSEEKNKENKEDAGGDVKPLTSSEVTPAPVMVNEATPTEKSSMPLSGDVAKLKPATVAEKQPSNGVANGC